MNEEPETTGLAALRMTAEAQALDEASLGDSNLSVEQQRRLLHDLRVHQIELEMQNDTLRAAQRELEASRDRYVELYEFAPVGYLTLNADGVIEQINLSAVKMLGHQRKHMLGRSFAQLIADQDRLRWRELSQRLRKDARSSDAKASFELNLRRADDSPLPVRLH